MHAHVRNEAMANGASGLADLLTLILCCGLLNAATRPPPPPPPRVVLVDYNRQQGQFGAKAGEQGDLPLIACAHETIERDAEVAERV